VNPPIVFVSYSWDSAQHQNWVRTSLVDGLRSRGVEAIMDVYNLSYGDQPDQFMEDFLGRCDHIIVVCTPNYAERSTKDLGGVGYEKVLIKRHMASSKRGTRLVPVLRDGTGVSVPAWVGNRLYADMRDDTANDGVLDELAALFYGTQLLHAPAVQAPPDWLKHLLSGQTAP
jgi:hypothetical protein